MENSIDLSKLDDKDYSEAVNALFEYKQLYRKKHPEYNSLTENDQKHIDNAIFSELVGMAEPNIIIELEKQ